MIPQYNICVAEGIRYIIGQYEESVDFGEIERYELTPFTGGWAARKFTPSFDFDSDEGFWQMAILPEIQQERQRQDIQSLVGSTLEVANPPSGGKKKWKTTMRGMELRTGKRKRDGLTLMVYMGPERHTRQDLL